MGARKALRRIATCCLMATTARTSPRRRGSIVISLSGHEASGRGWQLPLRGSWFPDAFANRMANLQRFASGEDDLLIGSVDDGWQTMALVEAAYQSSRMPATPLSPLPKE